MSAGKRPIIISDPAGYLKRTRPGVTFRKLRSACIDERLVPAYVISDLNACTVNAAACLVVFASGGRRAFDESLKLCMKEADKGFSRNSDGAVDYYTKLGKEAPFIRKCLKVSGAEYSANSSLFVKRRAMKEILTGRPVLLNIAFSGQYRDHTVTAYGFEEYAVGPRGAKRLFFKVRDGYSGEPRYLEFKHVIGISITYLKNQSEDNE